MRFTCFVPLLVGALAAPAASALDAGTAMAEDAARWDPVPVSREAHAAPPAGWTRVREPDLEVGLAFPCKPDRQRRTVDEREMVQLMCARGQRHYIAQIAQHDLPNLAATLGFLGSSTRALVDNLEKGGMNPELIPVKKVAFGDARGRQARVVADALEMEVRVMVRPGHTIMLGVRDAPGGLPGDLETFLDALELGGPAVP